MTIFWNGLNIDGDYQGYTPAKVSGPPENCYPAEGGYAQDCHVTNVEEAGELGEWINDHADEFPADACQNLDSLLSHIEYHWSEEIEEAVAEWKQGELDEGPDPDAAYDAWKDRDF